MPIVNDSAPVYFPPEDQIISKYFDLTKFLSLLSRKALFFCRLDKLEDQFEGLTPQINFEPRMAWHRSTNPQMEKPWTEEQMQKAVEDWYEYERISKEVNCVCCWNWKNHAN